MRKNVASQHIAAQMNSRTDGSPLTAGTVSVQVSINGAAQSAGAGAVTNRGGGHYDYAPSQAETDGDHIVFQFNHATGVNQVVQVFTNFPQTGDSFARIGTAGAGLTALGDTRIANLDATVSSRMATYTQPTGFLAATFPTGTVANQTNITGGTITTATNVTTVNGLAAGVITAASIAADAITAAKVADGAIDAATFAAGAINAAAIAADAITAAKIADGAIDAATFAAGAITAAAIATNAIDADAVAADAVTEIQSGLATAAGIAALNNISAAQVNAEVDTALVDVRLDELLAADSDIDGAAPPTVGSVFHELMTKTAGTFTYDQATDSLEANRDNIGTAGANLTIAAVTGAVGSVTGAVGSVTGNVGGNVVGSVGSVTGAVGSVTGAVGSVTGNVGGNVVGSVASVTGNVGGNVTGSVGSVASGGITAASIATGAIDADAIADGAIDAATFASGAITADAIAANAIGASELAADAVTEIQSGLATSAAVATLQTDTDDIQSRLPAALVGGRIDASVGAMAAGTVTAAAIATDAIDSDAIAASAVTEIQAGLSTLTAAQAADAVWDETLADHLTAGSTGNALNAAGAAGDPWSTALPGAYGAGTAGKIVGDNINATVSSRATQATADTIAAGVVTIASHTDDIGIAGAGLTAVPWNPAWDAEVQSEVNDGLVAYDAATGTDVSSAQTAIIAQVDANEAKIDILDTNVDQIEVIADKLDTMLQADGSLWQFTEPALELGPGGAGSGTDWTAGERAQIRQALGVTGTQADAVGGDLQELLDRPVGGGGGGGVTDWNAAQREQILAAVRRIPAIARAVDLVAGQPRLAVIMPAVIEAPAAGSADVVVAVVSLDGAGQVADLEQPPAVTASVAGRLGALRRAADGLWLASYRVQAGDAGQIRIEARTGETLTAAIGTVTGRDDRPAAAAQDISPAVRAAERAEAAAVGARAAIAALPRRNGSLAAHVVATDDLPLCTTARTQLAEDLAAATGCTIQPALELAGRVETACRSLQSESTAVRTLARMQAVLSGQDEAIAAQVAPLARREDVGAVNDVAEAVVRQMERLATLVEGAPRPGGWATPGDVAHAAIAVARRMELAVEALERIESVAVKMDELLEPDGAGSWRICAQALVESPQAPALLADDLKAVADDLAAQIRRTRRSER